MALGWVGRSVMTAEGRWGRLDLEEREGRPTDRPTDCVKVLGVCKKAVSHFRGQSEEGHWSSVSFITWWDHLPFLY